MHCGLYLSKSFILMVLMTSMTFFCFQLEKLAAKDITSYSGEKNNVQFAIYQDLQVVDKGKKVYGFRFSFPLSENSEMIGFDLGGWGRSKKYFYGAGVNLLGTYSDLNADGLSVNCLFNYTGWNFSGFSFAGVLNIIDHRISGIQASVITSLSRQVDGIQFSLFNYCEDLNGIQIGLVNFNNNGILPFTILFNYDNNLKSK